METQLCRADVKKPSRRSASAMGDALFALLGRRSGLEPVLPVVQPVQLRYESPHGWAMGVVRQTTVIRATTGREPQRLLNITQREYDR
jgi:hypothetical protein